MRLVVVLGVKGHRVLFLLRGCSLCHDLRSLDRSLVVSLSPCCSPIHLLLHGIYGMHVCLSVDFQEQGGERGVGCARAA